MKKLSIASVMALCVSLTPLGLSAHANHDENPYAGTSYKYVELNKIGDPAKVLVVKEAKVEPLAKGEVRIAILAAPIHPSNLLQIAGNYGIDAVLPSTPGSEGVGRVMELSKQVKHLKVGQLVLLTGVGTWRQQIVMPAAKVIPVPDMGKLSDEIIEQLGMPAVNPMSALLMLEQFVDLKEGDWIVQSAANSAVGGYLIQLAKLRGIKTVNVVRREGLAEDLMAKGGDVVLINSPTLAADIAKATNGAPVVLAIDAVGGETFSRMAAGLTNGGTIVSYGAMSGEFPALNPATIIFNDIRIRGFWLSKWFQTAAPKDIQAAFGKIIPAIAMGKLKADIDSRYSVEEITAAVTRAAERGRNGKVLITPNKK